MTYMIVTGGESRAFPSGESFLEQAAADADIVLYLGGAKLRANAHKAAILVELGHECLGVHTGEGGGTDAGEEGSNILGFNRYRNGDDEPSNLIELVRQPRTEETALLAAKALFEAAGFDVAVCSDQAGRIIDRLVQPKYNAALRFLDEGLASAKDMDLTCRMGLGYPEGPIERVCRGGLATQHDITQALFETYGTPGYAPARRAMVAKQRAARE